MNAMQLNSSSQMMRRATCLFVLFATGLVVLFTAPVAASSVAPQTQMLSPTKSAGGSQLQQFAPSPDGSVWYAFDRAAGTGVARRQPSGATQTFQVDAITGITQKDPPSGLAVTPDGTLWFSHSFVSAFTRITSAGVVTTAPFTADAIKYFSASRFVALDDGSAFWYTNAGDIGRISDSGSVMVFGKLSQPFDSSVLGAVQGSDGGVWITRNSPRDFNNQRFSYLEVVRIDPVSGVSQVYEISTPADLGEGASGPTAAADGIWFALGHELVHVSYVGAAVRRVPTPFAGVSSPIAAPTGMVLFRGTRCSSNLDATQGIVGDLGAMDAAGNISTVNNYTFPEYSAYELFRGPEATIWWDEWGAGAPYMTSLDAAQLTPGDLRPAGTPPSAARISGIVRDKKARTHSISADIALGRCKGEVKVRATKGSASLAETGAVVTEFNWRKIQAISVSPRWTKFAVSVLVDGQTVATRSFDRRPNSLRPELKISSVRSKIRRGRKVSLTITVLEGYGKVSARLSKGRMIAPAKRRTTTNSKSGAKTYRFVFRPRHAGNWKLRAKFNGLGAWSDKNIRKRIKVDR